MKPYTMDTCKMDKGGRSVDLVAKPCLVHLTKRRRHGRLRNHLLSRAAANDYAISVEGVDLSFRGGAGPRKVLSLPRPAAACRSTPSRLQNGWRYCTSSHASFAWAWEAMAVINSAALLLFL
jgi:hypothetical protein